MADVPDQKSEAGCAGSTVLHVVILSYAQARAGSKGHGAC